MPSPFPDLPRGDCAFTPTVEAFSGPMVPKPLWTGATSYNDPNFPSGGGPDDVPAAPPSMGQATPATVSPPTQTSMGGSGGSIQVVKAMNYGLSGIVNVQNIVALADPAESPNYELTGTAYNIRYYKD